MNADGTFTFTFTPGGWYYPRVTYTSKSSAKTSSTPGRTAAPARLRRDR